MPIGIFQAALAFVLEKFVNRREQDARPFRIDPYIKVELVVHKMDIAASEHGKKSSRDLEILGVNDPFLDGEISGRIPGNAVAGARNNQIQDSGERAEHRNGENIAGGHLHLAAALHCSRVVAETADIVADV